MVDNYACRRCGCTENNGNVREQNVYGALEYLRNSYCRNACGSRGYSLRCGNCAAEAQLWFAGRANVAADDPCLTGCSGDRVFYTGVCGPEKTKCSSLRSCCGRDGSCCCGRCARSDDSRCGANGIFEGAAEFVAMAPQIRSAGSAFVFNGECDTCGIFTADAEGIHINRGGRYLAIYSFAADMSDNAATVLSMAVNGNEIYASRCCVSPGVISGPRSVMGQAVFCAGAGDVLTLNTSVALNIPQMGAACPLLTVVILKIN